MNRHLVDRIVHAVLYEGYLLYPYRPSVKNRQRWTFGGLYPQAYVDAQKGGGSDSSLLQTECLVRSASGGARVDVTIRFLHLMNRTSGVEMESTWQEAIEREVSLEALALDELLAQRAQRRFGYSRQRQVEPTVVREQQAVEGSIAVSATATGVADLYRLTVRVTNETPFADAAAVPSRDDALMRSLVSTHTILIARGGAAFVSMTDPPGDCGAAAEACRNIGAWPILVGEHGETDTVLASPIILYDYPQLAPESPGDLFDATEIDEILTLRVLTLTDDEKRQMIATDPRASALLQRTESLTQEQLMSLHGTLRELRPIGSGTVTTLTPGGAT
jgi:hypothetical protein